MVFVVQQDLCVVGDLRHFVYESWEYWQRLSWHFQLLNIIISTRQSSINCLAHELFKEAPVLTDLLLQIRDKFLALSPRYFTQINKLLYF